MSVDLSTLVESQQTETEDESFETDDEQLMADINDSLVLLKRAKTFIDYVSDPNLIKTISKRERLVMEKLSSQLNQYIEHAVASYGIDQYEDISL